jgi:hypothetical protein
MEVAVDDGGGDGVFAATVNTNEGMVAQHQPQLHSKQRPPT